MTNKQQRVIDQLRAEGYAITYFTPDELQGANGNKVEQGMVDGGWDAIETFQPVNDDGK